MVSITQNFSKQAEAHCHAARLKKVKVRKAGSVSTGSERARGSTTISTPESADRTLPAAIAVAVNSALRVSTRLPYGYLLAATLMNTSSLAQAQGFPASIFLTDLDGSNGFVINGVDARDFSGSSVSDAGDINGDGVADVIIGASPNGYSSTGESYVIFGGSVAGGGGSLDLSSLDGATGFTIEGIDSSDGSGHTVSGAGDFNGDGVSDLIIGARYADTNGTSQTGQSYLVFGGGSVGSSGSLNLADLDGINGFVINGIDEADRSGFSVSDAGDINGDGLDDVIIGAVYGGPSGMSRAGESYVVFGKRGVVSSGVLNLASIDGTNGFVINGIDTNDNSGYSVSDAGDINGDGVTDVIIGATRAGPNGNDPAGESYIVFGGSSVGSNGSLNLSSLDGTNGFVINGIDQDDRSGNSVSGAGDINGDGVDDVIIGASYADPNGISIAGESYVVFGGSGVGSGGSLNLLDLNGSNGFVINGIDQSDFSGDSVSGAGDINGDGVGDVIIGASLADRNGNSNAGEAYVVFGGRDAGSGGSLNLSDLNGVNGFVINGIDAYDFSGLSVSGAGDINGDGLDDVIIGAAFGDPNSRENAGESYVVFGATDMPLFPSGPDNNQFANAENLIGVSQALASGSTLTVSGTTVEATAQSGEPAHFPGGFGLTAGPRNSIWYRWIANADQVVEIDTAGSAVATVLVAYTGATVSGLQEVAMGIDNVRQVARIRFAVRAGETYHIAVDGYDNNSEGDIQLNIRQPTMDLSECTITGTDGPDVLTGTAGPDVICGLDGNDIIRSLGGSDIVFAGEGEDFVSSSGGRDIVFGEDGNDILVGGSGNDLLVGGLLGDRIFGGSGNDIVFGNSGADRLFGADGNDDLFGEMGGDRLFGGTGNDNLDGGLFIDLCSDSDGNNTFVSCE